MGSRKAQGGQPGESLEDQAKESGPFCGQKEPGYFKTGEESFRHINFILRLIVRTSIKLLANVPTPLVRVDVKIII